MVSARHVPHRPGQILLLYGSGGRAYREYLLRSISTEYPLWLFTAAEPTWELPYLAGYTIVDTLSAEAAETAARDLAQDYRIAGVVCYDEVRVIQAAHVATALGLPTSPPDAVLACRDKRLSRELMDAAAVPSATSICVSDLDGARQAAARIGYPVIIKPRALAGSEGVGVVREEATLAGAVAAALRAHFTEVPRFTEALLVEEYLDGPEISIDSVVFGGQVWPLFLAHKQLDIPGSFEETGHLVTADGPLLHDAQVTDVLQRAHRALGFTHGITHTELRLTADGPRVVEVNGRLGGDLIPYLGLLATGIDPGLLAVALATGHRPDLAPTRIGSAGVRFLYPDRDRRFERLDIDRAALPHGVWEVRQFAAPGQELRLPPLAYVSCRAGAAIAMAADEKSCNDLLDVAAAAVTVVGEPLPVSR